MPRPVRLWLPVVISFAIQVPAVAFLLAHERHLAVGGRGISLAMAVLGPLALIGARRFPGPVVAITAAAASVDLLVSPAGWPPYVALGFAIILGVARGARTWAFSSVAAAWVSTFVGAILLGRPIAPGRIAALTLGVLLCMGIGEAVRSRREHIRELREATVRRRTDAAQTERVRIARELHDVLAHSLSQINVQASVGLHLIDRQPEKAAEALASIKQSSKAALDDVRVVLGMLRGDGEAASDDRPGSPAPLTPQEDLSRLPTLVQQASQGGLSVRLENRLPGHPPDATQFAVYRIVQEALTNVIRHAGASAAVVSLAEHNGYYLVQVRDNGVVAIGATVDNVAEPVFGRGILGMRERVQLLGGSLQVGAADGGGFQIVARIPVRGEP